MSVNDLMNIVYSAISEPPFCFIFENDIDVDDYIVLEMEDMILVNGYLKELKPYNSNNINLDVIFMALNESIFDYINCIKAEGDYSSEFGDDYVQITLKNSISSVRDKYDYISIGCMPSLGMITINALACSDMVDSNIQREEILPSEKALASKMKLNAMKHIHYMST